MEASHGYAGRDQKKVTTVIYDGGLRHELKPGTYTEFDVVLNPGPPTWEDQRAVVFVREGGRFQLLRIQVRIKDFTWSD